MQRIEQPIRLPSAVPGQDHDPSNETIADFDHKASADGRTTDDVYGKGGFRDFRLLVLSGVANTDHNNRRPPPSYCIIGHELSSHKERSVPHKLQKKDRQF